MFMGKHQNVELCGVRRGRAMAKNQEFRVTISGVDLTPEYVERIDRAVKAAVLTEIASLAGSPAVPASTEAASPAVAVATNPVPPVQWSLRGPKPPIRGIVVMGEETRE
jgi:hypothetical protein